MPCVSLAVWLPPALPRLGRSPAPRLSYGAQKLVCEILIDDYTRRGYIDGRALRLPAVMVRPGSANTAVSGWVSALIREPLAGRDYACPVRPDTRLACISTAKVVQCFLRALELPGEALGPRRTVLLTGTPHGVGFARQPPVFLKPGDTITVEIDRIGTLTNPVIREAP